MNANPPGPNGSIAVVPSTTTSATVSATHVFTNTASVSSTTNVISNFSSSGSTVAGSSAVAPPAVFSNPVYSSSIINSSSALPISGSDSHSDNSAFSSVGYNPVNGEGDSSGSFFPNVTNASHSNVMTTVTSNASVNSNLGSSLCNSAMLNTAAIALAELRKACIHLLLSMLPLPLHFQVNYLTRIY